MNMTPVLVIWIWASGSVPFEKRLNAYQNEVLERVELDLETDLLW